MRLSLQSLDALYTDPASTDGQDRPRRADHSWSAKLSLTSPRRDAGAVDRSGLENRKSRQGPGVRIPLPPPQARANRGLDLVEPQRATSDRRRSTDRSCDQPRPRPVDGREAKLSDGSSTAGAGRPDRLQQQLHPHHLGLSIVSDPSPNSARNIEPLSPDEDEALLVDNVGTSGLGGINDPWNLEGPRHRYPTEVQVREGGDSNESVAAGAGTPRNVRRVEPVHDRRRGGRIGRGRSCDPPCDTGRRQDERHHLGWITPNDGRPAAPTCNASCTRFHGATSTSWCSWRWALATAR